MEIKSFTIADLKTVLSSNGFWRTKTLPITKHRAIAQIHNPRADENDTALLVAYQDGDVIGHLGILPDQIFMAGETFKLGWLTSWWVDPQRATAGVGTALLFRALNAYSQQIGVSGSSKAAGTVLRASQKFVSIDPLRGLEMAFHFDSASKMLNYRIEQLEFEYISAIDEETNTLLQNNNLDDLTRKGKRDLDWIMTYPWILSAPLKDRASARFYFSSIAARFYYLGVKVFTQGKGLIGFFMLKVRDDRQSLLYCYFENQHAAAVSTALVHHAKAMGADRLSLYDQRLVASIGQIREPDWSSKAASRGFMLTKPLAERRWAGRRLQGGDGDLAFY